MTLEQTIQEHVVKLPAHLQSEVLDYVLYLEQKPRRQAQDSNAQRKAVAETLARLVNINPFQTIDPDTWEREQRADRNLPGRT